MLMPSWPQVPLWRNNTPGGLSEVKEILEILGSPHTKLPPTIHIAGTNGKGSSLAMLKTIYEMAGYKVHSYTSPHLLEFNERIYLSGKNISDEYINELIIKVREACDIAGYEPSFFQGTTIIALMAFVETPADILILETGMGGRLDPTNVIENPILTLITPISYDHMEHLGDTLEKIAIEKAGIMKTGTPCIISAQTQEVYDTLFEEAAKKEVEVLAYEHDFGINLTENGFEFLMQDLQVSLPRPSLMGNHQYINAASVVASVLTLNKYFKVKTDHIKAGLANTTWLGRIEQISNKKKQYLLPDNINLYLDGAHNSGGAQCLADWAKNLTEPVIVILGMTKNRNPVDFLNNFVGVAHKVITVRVVSEPSSYEASRLAELAKPSGLNIDYQYDIEEALEYVKNTYSEQKVNLIVTGSLFLVADCYKLLKLR